MVTMIEQIPLTLVIDNTVVVGPTAIVVLRHNQSLILIRSHRILTHGISEYFGILPHVWVGQVVIAIVLECEWSLRLSVGQVFEAIHTRQLELTVAPLDGLRRCVVGQFLHIGLEFGTTAGTPENVGIAIRSLKHAGVYAADSLDVLRLRNERTFRTVCDGNTDAEASTIFWG